MIRAAGSTSDDEGPKPSAHRFRLLRYGPDRRELIGGQRLLGKQQAAAFVEVGAPCAQYGSRLLEGLRDDVAHRHVDLALRRLGGFDAMAAQVKTPPRVPRTLQCSCPQRRRRVSPLVGASLLFVSKGGGVVLSERVFFSPESDRRSISASSKAPSTISRVSKKRSCREGPTALAPAGGKSWSRLIPTPSRTQTPLLVGCCARSRGPDLCVGVRAISSSHLPSHSLSERLSCFRRSIACAA
jgi:hypothetical protein